MILFISFLITLGILYIVPFIVYGLFAVIFHIKEPEAKLSFLLGVLIQKIGTSVGFVGFFILGKDYFLEQWLLYSMVWVGIFALAEIGQLFMSDYSKKEAVAGVISEVIYFPLAAAVLASLV